MYVWKRGAGRPVILIHGMFGDHLDWEPVLAPLAERRQVLAVDLPGFGASPKPAMEYTAEVFLSALRQAIRDQTSSDQTSRDQTSRDQTSSAQTSGAETVSLVGNSFGGQIAMLYALAYPREVADLTLIDSGGFSDYTDAEKQMQTARLSEQAILNFTPDLTRALFRALFVTESADSRRYVEKQVARLGSKDYPAYAAAVASSIRLSVNTCLLDRLKEIRCPVHLLWGACDRVAPVALAQKALPLFHNSQLTVVPECGHVPQIEKPAEFLRIVE